VDYFVIGDEDTVLGFRYAGVEGRVARTSDEARAALAERVEGGGTGIVILTDEIANVIQDEVNRLRFEGGGPLVVQIPGPEGPLPERPDLPAIIQDALGIRI